MAKPSDVQCDTDIPPSAKLPVYKMQEAPVRFALIELLRAGELPVVEPSEEGADSVKDPTRLRIGEDGAFEIYPNFKELARLPARDFPSKAVLCEAAKRILDAVVPRDKFTSAKATEGRLLSYARREIEAPKDVEVPKQSVLLYISARRRVQDLPVDGPGSRITIAVDASTKVHGAVYDWKEPVWADEATVDPPSPEKVKETILEQLCSAEFEKGVRVKRVELAYYDDGETLQPVYRYVAEFGQDCNSYGAPDVLTGYVPFLATSNVPVLGDAARQKARKRAKDRDDDDKDKDKERSLDVGRYIGRELSTGWNDSSEAFWTALSEAPGPLRFVDADHQHAEPEHFGDARDKHINRVDVALLEAHGLPMGFATKGDEEESVYLELDVTPEGGYGFARREGKLKHWILHSCNAVTTEVELKEWAEQWGPLFKGLATIVGYRSVMFVNDGAPAVFALSLASKAPVVPAWFNAVASLNVYARDSEVTLRCAGDRKLGRPSAIVAGDSDEATPVDAGPKQAKWLQCWWIDDCIETTSSVDITENMRVRLEMVDPPRGCPEEGGGPGSVPGKRRKRRRRNP